MRLCAQRKARCEITKESLIFREDLFQRDTRNEERGEKEEQQLLIVCIENIGNFYFRIVQLIFDIIFQTDNH